MRVSLAAQVSFKWARCKYIYVVKSYI